ncbi:uncharacterized protein LOC129597183 [Paramacrobiotus metropolitanus]|uniref:uncharacterized protein LOC129597183 n=1 Tax=Paramacrobiotus metropolitanus TaxID=2943436 RepID=UPI002445E4D5|nr:uncharacterized protein LOC129597183 [Paramacrobiotus metropolitanus]
MMFQACTPPNYSELAEAGVSSAPQSVAERIPQSGGSESQNYADGTGLCTQEQLKRETSPWCPRFGWENVTTNRDPQQEATQENSYFPKPECKPEPKWMPEVGQNASRPFLVSEKQSLETSLPVHNRTTFFSRLLKDRQPGRDLEKDGSHQFNELLVIKNLCDSELDGDQMSADGFANDADVQEGAHTLHAETLNCELNDTEMPSQDLPEKISEIEFCQQIMGVPKKRKKNRGKSVNEEFEFYPGQFKYPEICQRLNRPRATWKEWQIKEKVDAVRWLKAYPEHFTEETLKEWAMPDEQFWQMFIDGIRQCPRQPQSVQPARENKPAYEALRAANGVRSTWNDATSSDTAANQEIDEFQHKETVSALQHGPSDTPVVSKRRKKRQRKRNKLDWLKEVKPFQWC